MGAKLLLRIIRGFKSGRCWATQRHLAEQMGRCRRSIKRYLAELREAGLVTISVQQRNMIRQNIVELVDPVMPTTPDTPAAARSRPIDRRRCRGMSPPGTNLSPGWGQICPRGGDRFVPTDGDTDR